jgi:hypothetical protein
MLGDRNAFQRRSNQTNFSFIQNVKNLLPENIQKELGLLNVTQDVLEREMQVIHDEIYNEKGSESARLISQLRSQGVSQEIVEVDTQELDHDIQRKMEMIHQVRQEFKLT